MLFALVLACTESMEDTGLSYDPNDVDGDGVGPNEGDCDDLDATVLPGAAEVYYDGRDQNCDGLSDDDADLDGYDVNVDCNDANAAIFPGAAEVCDGSDNDCDGDPDLGAPGGMLVYVDADADGYAPSNATSKTVCDGLVPVGYTLTFGDCDDAQPLAAPGLAEVCDGIDNDCDGSVDLGAVEVDDGLDQDCDGFVDEDFLIVGDLVITEITRQPGFGSGSVEYAAVWFELYNRSGRDVNLSNFSWHRAEGFTETLSFAIDPVVGLVAPAGGLVTFCASAQYDQNSDAASILHCDYVFGSVDGVDSAYVNDDFMLGVAADRLSLSVGENMLDSVEWADDGTWFNQAGVAMQLSAAALDGVSNDLAEHWCGASSIWYDNGVGVVEYGSPGVANPVCE